MKGRGMAIPEKSAWPKSVDGTTDWQLLFEEEETGLIALTGACTTPEQLKQQAEAIIQAIFTRKQDASIVAKVKGYLDKLIPENADPERLPVMLGDVAQMLRKVKDDRIKKAAAFVEKKARQAVRKKRKKKPNRRGNPVLEFLYKNNTAMVILVLMLGALVPLGIYLSGLSTQVGQVGEGDVKKHISWIRKHVNNHMPHDTWVLQSVKQSSDTQISVTILVTDPDHIDAIHAMRLITRVAVFEPVCPKPNSGIKDILNMGWTLWVTLNSPHEMLTGGTCKYEP